MKAKILQPLNSFFQNCKAAVVIEAAFILPILLLLCVAGINVSLYLTSVATTNKTADMMANALSTASKYDNTTLPQAQLAAYNGDLYLTQNTLRNFVTRYAPPMMNKTAATAQARVIVSSFSKQIFQPVARRWQCAYNFPLAAGGAVCQPALADDRPAQVTIATPLVANMRDGEGMIVVEVYQRYIPPLNFFRLPIVGDVPMIGETTIYSGAAYPVRVGQLNCLYPLPSPYNGGC